MSRPGADPEAVAIAVTGWVRESLDDVADPGRAVFVAEDEQGIVGFVTVSERAHFGGEIDAYVGELVVHPRTLRSGARSFYASLGYEEEDVRLSKAL